MNRLKLWLFALVVIGLAALGLQQLAGDLSRQGLDATDRQLRAALARADAAERSATGELAILAGIAAQDAKLQAAVHAGNEAPAPTVKPKKGVPPPPPPQAPEQLDTSVDQAAADAVAAALAAAGPAKLDRVVLASTRDGLQRKPPADADAAAFLQDALDRKVRRGYAVLGGRLHAGASVPVSDRGALAVFVPVDSSWAAERAGDTGAAVLLTAPGAKLVIAGKVSDVDGVLRAVPKGLAPASFGQLAPVDVTPSWWPLKMRLPAARSLLGPMPAERLLSLPLSGITRGQMVVAMATRPALDPVVRLQWYALAALAAVFLLAIPFSILVKPSEVAAALPPVLIEAARKVEKGDFSVRVPVLAGKLGTLAAALNKAVEAAQSGPTQTPVSSVTSEFFARGPVPADGGGADPFSLPTRPARAAPLAPESKVENDTARLDGANLSGAAFEAAPVAAPRPVPVREPAPAPARAVAHPPASSPSPTPVPTAAAPELLAGAARAGGDESPDEEQHWREVFRDFVRTRAQCGESAEGLTYERFRQKLESNKGALVTKYGCKTVRFQVYVKDGKAALKATPVR